MSEQDLKDNIYGWNMRIMQSEEDILMIRKRLSEMIDIKNGLVEELKNLTLSEVKE